MVGEEILEEAICREYRREMDDLSVQEELCGHIRPSLEFFDKMEKMLRKWQRRERLLRLLKKGIIFFFVMACSILLLCVINEDVRTICDRWLGMAAQGGGENFQETSIDTDDLDVVMREPGLP